MQKIMACIDGAEYRDLLKDKVKEKASMPDLFLNESTSKRARTGLAGLEAELSTDHLSAAQREHRTKALQIFMQVNGGHAKVTNENAPNVAAFVPFDEPTAYVAVETLDLALEEVRKIAVHEHKHVCDIIRGIKKIDLESNINLKRIHILNEALHRMPDGFKGPIQRVNLIEGLTEARTALQEGENCHCAYNHHEVPAVKALEKLTKETLGLSLFDAYENGLADFYERIAMVCDRLILEEMAENLQPEAIRFVIKDASIEREIDATAFEDIRTKLLERIRLEKIVARDMADARRIFLKFLKEALIVYGLEKAFGLLQTA